VTVKTTWDVTHICGHEQAHDLSAKRVSERAGYARWLSTKDCGDCYFAKRDASAGQDREAWLASKRAEEAAATETWETKAGMTPLMGSPKAVGWATRVRHQLLSAAYDVAGPTDDEFEARVLVPARRITSASWWIDQRDADAEDIAELVVDAGDDPRGGVCENDA